MVDHGKSDLTHWNYWGCGFRILARNVHLRHAEVDLVSLEGHMLCFVEVRLRSSTAFGSAEESSRPHSHPRPGPRRAPRPPDLVCELVCELSRTGEHWTKKDVC